MFEQLHNNLIDVPLFAPQYPIVDGQMIFLQNITSDIVINARVHKYLHEFYNYL